MVFWSGKSVLFISIPVFLIATIFTIDFSHYIHVVSNLIHHIFILLYIRTLVCLTIEMTGVFSSSSLQGSTYSVVVQSLSRSMGDSATSDPFYLTTAEAGRKRDCVYLEAMDFL